MLLYWNWWKQSPWFLFGQYKYNYQTRIIVKCARVSPVILGFKWHLVCFGSFETYCIWCFCSRTTAKLSVTFKEIYFDIHKWNNMILYLVSCDTHTMFQQLFVYCNGVCWSTVRRRQSEPVRYSGIKWFVHNCRISIDPLLSCAGWNLAGCRFVTLITLFFMFFIHFSLTLLLRAYCTEEKCRIYNFWKGRAKLLNHAFGSLKTVKSHVLTIPTWNGRVTSISRCADLIPRLLEIPFLDVAYTFSTYNAAFSRYNRTHETQGISLYGLTVQLSARLFGPQHLCGSDRNESK